MEDDIEKFKDILLILIPEIDEDKLDSLIEKLNLLPKSFDQRLKLILNNLEEDENIIDNNKSRSLDIIIFVFFTIDCILTYLAINSYVDRAKIAYGYNIKAEANNIVTNEVMKFLFPNMIYEKDVNNKVLIRDIFSNNYLRHYHF